MSDLFSWTLIMPVKSTTNGVTPWFLSLLLTHIYFSSYRDIYIYAVERQNQSLLKLHKNRCGIMDIFFPSGAVYCFRFPSCKNTRTHIPIHIKCSAKWQFFSADAGLVGAAMLEWGKPMSTPTALKPSPGLHQLMYSQLRGL